MMVYTDIFKQSDNQAQILDQAVQSTTDPWAQNRYIGFLSVTAVTFFEEAFKDILFEFAKKKHPVFGTHVKEQYSRLNGRIALNEIRTNHIKKFGSKYSDRFKKILNEAEQKSLKEGSGSIKTSYGNILTWRNNFVHGGAISNTATYSEARDNYELGKAVFHCLNRALYR
ncbi:MAG: HEPN domain-containing protein [Stappiaceae bacterium]